mgnify:CR=1 FL=1
MLVLASSDKTREWVGSWLTKKQQHDDNGLFVAEI